MQLLPLQTDTHKGQPNLESVGSHIGMKEDDADLKTKPELSR